MRGLHGAGGFDQLIAAHVRHLHVADEQIDGEAAFQDLKRFAAVGGFLDREAEVAQRFGGDEANQHLVFGDEDAGAGLFLGEWRHGVSLLRGASPA